MKSVYIIGGGWGEASIFLRRGWEIITDEEANDGAEPDLTVLTGGADINPAIYGEPPHPTSWWSDRRDKFEIEMVQKFWHVPCAGICRGGQLLNALIGGKMYQDIDRHAGGRHTLLDLELNKKFMVTSLHHQMMIPAKGAEIIAISNLTTRRHLSSNDVVVPNHDTDPDIEVLYYPKEQKLCFQGHPEYGHKESEDYFFNLIERKIGL